MHTIRNLAGLTGVTGVTTAAALGSGLAGGVFFAFSSFVVPALRRLPSGQGIAAIAARRIG